MKKALQTHGFVLYHKPTGSIWPETFSPDKNLCKAYAVEMWALMGEMKKDNPGWKIVRADRLVLIDFKYID